MSNDIQSMSKAPKIYTKNIDKVNNFDLVRLFAALQVVLDHSSHHLGVKLPAIFQILSYFPGVPIFFGVSGFLIANAYLRNPNIKIFFRNRILRLYPALWVCTIATIIIFFCFKIINFRIFLSFSFLKWVVCQITFCQFYTVDYLRNWGVGTPNGSLWTIAVELQFYFILPFVIMIIKNCRKWVSFQILFILFFSSLIIGHFYVNMNQDSLYAKVIHVSLAPYFFYFCFGIFSLFIWEKIKKYIEGKFLIWACIYLLFVLIFSFILKLYTTSYYPNLFGFISNILLWILILAFAFSNNTLSHKMLRGIDISYGVYIYHMLVVNSILSFNLTNIVGPLKIMITIGITMAMGLLSWVFIESPALKRKKATRKATI